METCLKTVSGQAFYKRKKSFEVSGDSQTDPQLYHPDMALVLFDQGQDC